MKRLKKGISLLLFSLVSACGQQLVEFPTGSICGPYAPVVTSIVPTPLMPNTGDLVQVSAVISDDDVDKCMRIESFSYRWTLLAAPAGSRAVLFNTDSSLPWFRPDLNGSYLVRLVVTDSTGLNSQPLDVAIPVLPCGAKLPVITMINAYPMSPMLGQQVALVATVTDDNTPSPCNKHETFSYAWTMISQPSLPVPSIAQLAEANTARPTFVPDQAGVYQVELIVTDSDGHVSAPAAITITAGTCGNSVPVAQIGILAPIAVAAPAAAPPQIAVQEPLNVPVQLDASTSTDPDNSMMCALAKQQSLSFSWRFEQMPQGSRATFNDPHLTNPSFTPDMPGPYVIDLVVTDSTGLASIPARVMINGFNPQPSVAWGAGPYTSLALDGTDPRIAFYDKTRGGAYIATCSGASCATNPIWSINTIDNGNAGVGRMISLAAAAGVLYAVYWDALLCEPRYAVSTDTGKTWLTSSLQPNTNNNLNGTNCTPLLSNVGDGQCTGLTWGIDWRDHGAFPSVAIGPVSGNPVVAFVGYVQGAQLTCKDKNNQQVTYNQDGYNEIRVAVCTANCKTNNPTWAIKSAAVGANRSNARMGYTSITFDPVSKHSGISFRSNSYGNGLNALGYVTCTANCDTSPTYSSVAWIDPDSGFDTFQIGQGAGVEATTTSLAFSSTGVARIAYYDGRNQWLRLADCAAGCDVVKNWNGIVVDASGIVGPYASLALSPLQATLDRPRIAYLSGVGGAATLRYAQQALDGSWSWTDLDNSAGYISLKLSAADGPRVSHFNTTAVRFFTSGN